MMQGMAWLGACFLYGAVFLLVIMMTIPLGLFLLSCRTDHAIELRLARRRRARRLADDVPALLVS
jgi:hypothetical protein